MTYAILASWLPATMWPIQILLLLIFNACEIEQHSTQTDHLDIQNIAVTPITEDLYNIHFDVEVVSPYHVQANPASQPYLVPTSVELASIPGIDVLRITYPKGHPYTLEGSDEAIMVYDGIFSIQMKIITDHFGFSDDASISGQLNYQACDHKTCFRPKSKEFTIDLNKAT